MGKDPIYAIVALIFIGIIKLLQVTAFDAEKYTKKKKAGFSKKVVKTEMPKVAEQDTAAFDPSEPESQVAEGTPPPVLDRTQKDSLESTGPSSFDNNDPEEEDPFSSQPSETDAPKAYNGLDELKNTYLAPKIANLPPGQLREDVVIRYYRHDQDGDKVYALKKLGYYLHEKEAIETAGLGSNVMYYGNDVNIEDIQIVAYTLLAEGLPIKSIEPTRFAWKSNAIEIGTNPDMLEAPGLSIDDVRRFRK